MRPAKCAKRATRPDCMLNAAAGQWFPTNTDEPVDKMSGTRAGKVGRRPIVHSFITFFFTHASLVGRQAHLLPPKLTSFLRCRRINRPTFLLVCFDDYRERFEAIGVWCAWFCVPETVNLIQPISPRFARGLSSNLTVGAALARVCRFNKPVDRHMLR